MESALRKKLEEAISKHKFSVHEMVGFTTKPNLALLAGALIGYKEAMDDVQAQLNTLKQ